MVSATASRLDTKEAATYSEQIFRFLLRVLDVRALSPPSLAGCEADVEASATSALVALTMKLTESRFKPMFLRLLEWAAAATSAQDVETAGGDAGGRTRKAREAALFGVASALSARLRSVFVPYFRYLIDRAVGHLAGGAGSAAPKKKKRRGAAVDGGADADGDSELSWLLRVRVVRALHRGMLHDAGGFFDAEKLERLVPPLVAQLECGAPPVDVLLALAAQCSDTELDAGIGAGGVGAAAQLDMAGVAAAAALVQLAVTANSDVVWKPLNHRVLMATRSPALRPRLLALEVLVQVVERLREEYLPLLPETIPFLAELLEDVEPAVEARAQALMALLEDVSGEKLDQYLKI